MTRTPDEIKKAMLHCSPVSCRSNDCPYKDDTPKYEGDMPVCRMKLWHDMVCLIQQLEADKEQLEGLLHHMNQLRDAAASRALQMEERVHQLEAERDALMDYLQSMGCDTCLHDNYDASDSPCKVCAATRDMWVFEGVQKEESPC